MELLKEIDRYTEEVTLKRDIFGFKTQFFTIQNSELKVSENIEDLSSINNEDPDKVSLTQSLMFDFSDFRRTLYPSILSVAPGEAITFRKNKATQRTRSLPQANK